MDLRLNLLSFYMLCFISRFFMFVFLGFFSFIFFFFAMFFIFNFLFFFNLRGGGCGRRLDRVICIVLWWLLIGTIIVWWFWVIWTLRFWFFSADFFISSIGWHYSLTTHFDSFWIFYNVSIIISSTFASIMVSLLFLFYISSLTWRGVRRTRRWRFSVFLRISSAPMLFLLFFSTHVIYLIFRKLKILYFLRNDM